MYYKVESRRSSTNLPRLVNKSSCTNNIILGKYPNRYKSNLNHASSTLEFRSHSNCRLEEPRSIHAKILFFDQQELIQTSN